ncbi:MAG: urea ABC transporter substrate-binding protein [Planctomycetota bacterium]|nr:urea ABC transporter substrate-binding protein [Planctomycetota bacterium]
MKRIFLAVLLGFALGVTGCGGGGGGDAADNTGSGSGAAAPAATTEAPAKEAPAAPAKEAPAAPAKEAPASAAETKAPADDGTVKIGVLHSLSGTMAISETSLRDVVLMAAEEINAAGGVLGKKIVPEVVDPASNWPLFAEKAKELILEKKVAVTFGCWTSVSRKSCLPVFEEYNQLLFYPVQYEGEEQSLNVFYTAASPNQQLVPAAEYMMSEAGGKCTKFYLLGTDYVFPRTANKVLKAFLKTKGVPDENIREEYTPFHHQDYQTIVGKVKEFAAGGGACILSTINGDSNVPFYKEFANQGLTSADCPIMAFSVAEDELRAMDVPPLVGHLAAWNYFQSIDSPSNKKFVQNFKAYCANNKLPGGTQRVTDDPIEAAYFGVYVWKAAVEKAGSFDVDKVRQAVYGLEFDAPGGKKSMHPNNQHTLKPVYIGEILKDGQFKIVYQSEGLVSPDSYSSYLHPDGNFPAPTGGPKKK